MATAENTCGGMEYKEAPLIKDLWANLKILDCILEVEFSMIRLWSSWNFRNIFLATLQWMNKIGIRKKKMKTGSRAFVAIQKENNAGILKKRKMNMLLLSFDILFVGPPYKAPWIVAKLLGMSFTQSTIRISSLPLYIPIGCKFNEYKSDTYLLTTVCPAPGLISGTQQFLKYFKDRKHSRMTPGFLACCLSGWLCSLTRSGMKKHLKQFLTGKVCGAYTVSIGYV